MSEYEQILCSFGFIIVSAVSITAQTGTVLLLHSSVRILCESCRSDFYLAPFFPPHLDLIAGLLAVTALFLPAMGADGNVGLAEEVCGESVFVCVLMKSLCISDWSGSWSGLVRSRDKSPSSVLPNLVHPGEMFGSTSSTGKTTRQEHTRAHTHTSYFLCVDCIFLIIPYMFVPPCALLPGSSF